MFSEELKLTQKEQEMWEEYAKYEAEERKKFEEAFKYYKFHCLIPFEQVENNEDVENFDFENGTFRHIGYCSVEKSEYKNLFRPNDEYFKVREVDGDVKEDFEYLHFSKVKETDDFYELVWQTVGICGDDYSGYILYPMNDGRYWVVSFCNI